MNHKRKKPKHQRSGCLCCKPWKDERASAPPAPVTCEELPERVPAKRRRNRRRWCRGREGVEHKLAWRWCIKDRYRKPGQDGCQIEQACTACGKVLETLYSWMGRGQAEYRARFTELVTQ